MNKNLGTTLPTEVTTPLAPAPAGPYSQALRVGDLIILAGQTPRQPDGRRLLDEPLDVQVRRTMDNLEAVASAAGASLRDAVKVNVYLRPEADVEVFNSVYRDYVSAPLPARTTTISLLPGGLVEVDAMLWSPQVN